MTKNLKTLFLAFSAMASSCPAVWALPVGDVFHETHLLDSSRVHDLDEVVVVSQPKEQVRLRLQPVSSSVFGAQELQRLNVRDLSDLSAYVPSFTMPAYGSRLTSSMYIRGIGSRINNPAVSIYYDHIPLLSKAAFNSHFYMLDRVDVLRGPQGTLYGQNAEGGIVRIYSKNPMNYQGTDVRLGLGTGLYSNVEVAHYHRPSAKFAFTAAGFYSGLKGFVNNANFSEKNDLTNEAGGKMRFIYAPTRRLTFDLTTDYQYVNQNGFGYGEYDASANRVADPSTTLMNGYKRNMLNTGLNISYDMGRLLLTSTTSYQYLRDLMIMDQDYMAPDYLRLSQRQRQNTVTQELVLRSHDASRWQHASGLFASRLWLHTDAPVFFGDAITDPIAQGVAQAMQQMLPPGMTATMAVEMGVPERFRTPQTSLGVFHESNLLLADRLKLTLGLRLNHDHVGIDYDALAYMAMTGGVGNRVATYTLTSHVADHLSKSYTQLLPKLGLTWLLGEQLGNLYATVSKGYRTGGYNIQMFSDILQTDLNNRNNQQAAQRGDYDVPHTADDYANIEQTISYKPEESWNYELGTHLNLFAGKVHADASLFYMRIHNQQLSVMSGQYNYGRIMVNAGKSHSLGAELALRGSAVGNRLGWSAAYAFTSAKFDSYDTYDENHVPFVPQHTLGLSADYHFSQLLTFGASLTGQGKTWWDEANTYAQRFYATLAAHADLTFGPAIVTLWGRNLTDTRYNTFAIESSAAGGTRRFAQRGQPLQIGFDVRLHF